MTNLVGSNSSSPDLESPSFKSAQNATPTEPLASAPSAMAHSAAAPPPFSASPELAEAGGYPQGYPQAYQNMASQGMPYLVLDESAPAPPPRPNVGMFVIKVYAILIGMLLLTATISGFMMFNERARNWALNHRNSSALLWSMFALSIVSMIVAMCCKSMPRMAFAALVAFTLCESIFMGMICALYYSEGLGKTLGVAFVLTLWLFIGMSYSGWKYGEHLLECGGVLFIALGMLVVWGLANILFGWHTTFLYSLFGVILFSLYTAYDTAQMIHKFAATDDYVMAVIGLYLDFINLFLMILQLLDNR